MPSPGPADGADGAARATPGAARAAGDVARGDVVLVVPHLCVPWAAELAAALWRECGVRLLRRGVNRPPTDGAGMLAALERRGRGLGGGGGGRDGGDGAAKSGWVAADAAEESDPLADVVDDGLAEQFYPPLHPEDADYNEFVMAHLQRAHGPDVLGRIANLVRLAYVNGLLAATRREIVCASTTREKILSEQAELRRADAPSAGSDGAEAAAKACSACSAPKGTGEEASMSGVQGGGGSRQGGRPRTRSRTHVDLVAMPVTADGQPSKFIVHGSLVSSELLSGLAEALERDYHIRVSSSMSTYPSAIVAHTSAPSPLFLKPAAAYSGRGGGGLSATCSQPPLYMRASAPPAPGARGAYAPFNPRSRSSERVVDTYLADCFGISWATAFEQSLASSRRAFLEKRLAEVEKTLATASRAEDMAHSVRSRLVDAAVAYEVADASLSMRCAIGMAQTLSTPEINALYAKLPREAWAMVSAAKSRLEELENAESILLQSVFAKF